MNSIIDRINKRLGNEGKKEDTHSARKGGDVHKIKQPVQKVKRFTDNPARGRRVTNNATKPFRIQAAEAGLSKFRQESDQAVGPKPFAADRKEQQTKLNENTFVRVANSLFRNESSVLEQGERLIFDRLVKRELVKKMVGMKTLQHDKVHQLIEAGHLAEKQAQKKLDGEFMSDHTGQEPSAGLTHPVKQKLSPGQANQAVHRAQTEKDKAKFAKSIGGVNNSNNREASEGAVGRNGGVGNQGNNPPRNPPVVGIRI